MELPGVDVYIDLSAGLCGADGSMAADEARRSSDACCPLGGVICIANLEAYQHSSDSQAVGRNDPGAEMLTLIRCRRWIAHPTEEERRTSGSKTLAVGCQPADEKQCLNHSCAAASAHSCGGPGLLDGM